MTFRLEGTRRNFLQMSIAGGALLVLNGCGREQAQKATEQSAKESSKPGNSEKGGEVTATEDLMREHGVLRRALLVYSEAAAKLRTNPSAISTEALQKTAKVGMRERRPSARSRQSSNADTAQRPELTREATMMRALRLSRNGG